VIEPLVQGAAGLVLHPRGLLRRLRELCDRFDVLMIADEVASGFGRTGRMFACEHEDVVPDLLCLGKGLTGGYLPMAATLATSEIFASFSGTLAENRQFFHGHTYSGNALAAAAAIASLDVFEHERVLELMPSKAALLKQGLAAIAGHTNVGEIRQLGLMVGIELVRDRQTQERFDSSELIGRKVCEESTNRSVWVRPLGDVVILMPPLSIAADEIIFLTSTVTDAIHAVLGE